MLLIGLFGCNTDSGGDATGTAGTSTGVTTTEPVDETSAGSGGGAATSDSADTTTESGETEAGSTTTGPSDDSSSSNGSSSGGLLQVTFAECIDGTFEHGYPGIDFDEEDVVIGSHCFGTDHQTIADVERVVFLGDSITVGTPPSETEEFYRNILADRLANEFGLNFGSNEEQWRSANPLEGQSGELHSGDFSSCAEWGARNDDLLAGDQLSECYPEDDRNLITLTIMTSGGNDLVGMGRDWFDGVPLEDLWPAAEESVAHKRDTLLWLTDPKNFPNGHYVVFADIYDPSDGTGNFDDCALAGAAGFDDVLIPPDEIMHFLQRSYAELAVETGADLVFNHKEFCGRGHSAADPEARCYRGPASPVWFDFTCSHPNPDGHAHLADVFWAVVTE